jgi:hypothetical protein
MGYNLNGGFDSMDFPTSINVNNINALNDVLAPRRGFGQLSNFNELVESGDAKSFRSIPQVSAGGIPTFWDGKKDNVYG